MGSNIKVTMDRQVARMESQPKHNKNRICIARDE